MTHGPETTTVQDLGEEPFNPYDLRPLASLNRRPIAGLPGIDPACVGRRSWELCSKPALIGLIQDFLPAFCLKGVDPSELPYLLSDLLASPLDDIRTAAKFVADEHGRRLGYLIATLLGSPSGLTSPLTAWENAYLGHWQNRVREIVLGGGRANGPLGMRLQAAIAGALHTCGFGGHPVRLAQHPSYLPLIGAARSVRAGPWQAAAVADFGGTWAKRGLAFYDETGAVRCLRVLPPVPIAHLTAPDQTPALAATMVTSVADTIRRAAPGTRLAPEVICSVAAYVRNGRPLLVTDRNMGIYTWLYQLSDDITGWFSEQIAAACRSALRFQFAHDGDAAAHALTSQSEAAVIMLGTALGIGFVQPNDHFRPLAPAFTVEES